jgi:glucose/arabinose dehydrogenase
MIKQKLGILCCMTLLLTMYSPYVQISTDRGLSVTSSQKAFAALIQLEPFLAGLSDPLYLTSAKDGTRRLFIVERPGRIKVLQPGATTPTVFLDIRSKVLSTSTEQGLLGLSFHPDYEMNRRFFVNYTRQTDGATVIAEYLTSASDPDIADPGESVLLVIPQPFTNHNGGMIEFGPDGYLYLGTGDGGSANDPDNRAQNIDELLGKILRIDIDRPNGQVPYSSPPDNPFFGSIPGRDEIYGFGFRNPWRFSFDPVTKMLYAADVGQNAIEEIDVVALGGNYGWNTFEGTQCTGLGPTPCAECSSCIPPIAEYSHSAGRCAITGGYIYRGAKGSLPWGTYVYGDFCTGEIFMLEDDVQTLLLDTALSISSFGEDEGGELYVVNLNGTVDQIVNATQPPPCVPTISPAGKIFPSSGGIQTVTVTSSVNCNWMAGSNVSWITVTSGSSGNDNGVVTCSVSSNSDASIRMGKDDYCRAHIHRNTGGRI